MEKLHSVLMALLAGLLAPLALVAVSQAQSWPDRPAPFIVSQGPGSAQDIGVRMFADHLSKRWGQPVVIENKPGADGVVAITTFVGAHDNQTFLFTASGTFTAHPVLHAKVPYDPSDLVPIARVSTTVIAVTDVQAAATDPAIATRLAATGQVLGIQPVK